MVVNVGIFRAVESNAGICYIDYKYNKNCNYNNNTTYVIRLTFINTGFRKSEGIFHETTIYKLLVYIVILLFCHLTLPFIHTLP